MGAVTSTPRPLMEVLVGPVASGKSTYARKRAAAGALVVCDDAIVLACHGGNYDLYDPALKPLYVQVEAAIVTAAALAGLDVVVDTGGRTRAKRGRFLGLARALGFRTAAVTFRWETAEVHAARRFAHDPRGYSYELWLRVCREHEGMFEPITIAEDFDSVKAFVPEPAGVEPGDVRPAQ